MADLMIRKRDLIVSMGGASSVKSVSKPSNFALLMFFGGSAEVTSIVRAVNTIVIESVSSLKVETDYDSISTNNCIGTSIQTHGPPMVDIRSFLHSFTVFTVNSYNYLKYQTNNLNKIYVDAVSPSSIRIGDK
jgi:hypothetical protein